MDKIWDKCLSVIEKKVGESTFELWFKSIEIKSLDNNELSLVMPNRFYLDWIEDNYPNLIKNTVCEILKKDIDIVFVIEQNKQAEIKKEVVRQTIISTPNDKSIYLSSKYSFSKFVVGPSNQFAHAAALRVAESPGRAYNPFFVYGDVGLGKTHLISAIGNQIYESNRTLSIIYVQSEQFTNEVVTAIRHEKMSEFKNKYRNADVLLLDDVQFIANKTQTQEEFFYTFNALYEMQKQIVISSDRPPKEISAITDRLKSRFTMGLIADIQPPSVELKVAILHKKAFMENIALTDEVAYYLAGRIRSNIRELEGCLIKLAAFSTISGNPINMEICKQVLKDVLYDDDKPITIDFIQKKVADCFNIKTVDLKAKKRTKEVTIPRQVAMYLSKQMTDASLSDIGNAFSGKDHATVIYSCKKVDARRETDETFNRIIEQLINKIKS